VTDRESPLDTSVALPSERPRLAAISARARAMLAEATGHLDARERSWLQDMPLDRAVEAVSGSRPFSDYDVPRPAAFNRLEQDAAATGGDLWKLTYSRLLLLALVARLPGETLPLSIPSVLWAQVEDGLAPFVEEIPALGSADWSDGDFLKDLAVCQLRMLPSEGIALIVVRLHPWYLTSHARWRERVAVGRYLGLDTFRRGRYLTKHAWRGFKEGRARLPRRPPPSVALAIANPETVAVLEAAWMADPVLATISPHLQERAQLYLSLGGRRFRMSSSPEVVRMATSTSKTRRKLYEEGKYLPTTYGIFLKRRDLLRWAETASLDDEATD
jgi:hypothetical protein